MSCPPSVRCSAPCPGEPSNRRLASRRVHRILLRFPVSSVMNTGGRVHRCVFVPDHTSGETTHDTASSTHDLELPRFGGHLHRTGAARSGSASPLVEARIVIAGPFRSRSPALSGCAGLMPRQAWRKRPSLLARSSYGPSTAVRIESGSSQARGLKIPCMLTSGTCTPLKSKPRRRIDQGRTPSCSAARSASQPNTARRIAASLIVKPGKRSPHSFGAGTSAAAQSFSSFCRVRRYRGRSRSPKLDGQPV